MSKIEIKVWSCECERCKYRWTTKSDEIPKVCARCKSRIWEKVKGEIEKPANGTEIEIRKVEKTMIEKQVEIIKQVEKRESKTINWDNIEPKIEEEEKGFIDQVVVEDKTIGI